ncbi:MAG: DUF3365 domain-containing protein [Prochloraceae cyanobacterium]
MLICYVCSLIMSVITIGVWTTQEVYSAADKQLNILVDMVKAARTYVAEDVRPYMLEREIFHSPAVSSTVATKHIAEHFAVNQPDYYIRVVSDNPLNPDNKPTAFEQGIIQKFRDKLAAEESMEDLILEGKIKDKQYLVSSRPSISKESCLVCHGNPEDAPKEILDEYGTESGFNYDINAVVGASVVGVPIRNVNEIVLVRSLITFIFISIFFGLVFIAINRLVNLLVLKPIAKISHVARSVSEGNLNQSMSTKRDDEIGELVKSFELMRRSLVTASKRLRRNGKRIEK